MADTSSMRRRYSAAFKTRILAECEQPGASIAAIAMAHGINANLVHKWRAQVRIHPQPIASSGNDAFIPVPMAAPAAPGVAADIRIELRRRPVTVTLSWPMSAATECAHWLREVLL